MTHTSEFLSLMADRDHDERVALMARHVQQHGDATMTESLRLLLDHAEQLVTDPTSTAWEGLPDGIIEAFTDGNAAHRELVISVWNTWVDVVTAAREAGAVGTPTAATAATSATARRERRAPAPASTYATTAASSSRCPSCGLPSEGLCNRCEERAVLEDHIEYDRRLYEIDRERIEHDRLRDDRNHYDTSPSDDTSYATSYDPSFDDY